MICSMLRNSITKVLALTSLSIVQFLCLVVVVKFMILSFIMCEFLLPSVRCVVTGDFCRQSCGMLYLECSARELGFTLHDYSQFTSFVTGSPYPRPSPPKFDYERDVYLECPF